MKLLATENREFNSTLPSSHHESSLHRSYGMEAVLMYNFGKDNLNKGSRLRYLGVKNSTKRLQCIKV